MIDLTLNKFLFDYSIYRHHGGAKRLRNFGLKKRFINKKEILREAKEGNCGTLILENICTLDFLEIVAPHFVLPSIKRVLREFTKNKFNHTLQRGLLRRAIENDNLEGYIRLILHRPAFEESLNYLDRRQQRNLKKWFSKLENEYREKINTLKSEL